MVASNFRCRFQALLSLSLPLAASGCEDSFSPDAPFERRMVIYSVLSTQSDTQFVRVYSTYDSPGNDATLNADERSIDDASVVLYNRNIGFSLRPLEFDRRDKTRYSSTIHAFVAHPYKVERGQSYSLSVASATFGTAGATTIVPTKADLRLLIVSPFFLDFPWSRPNEDVNLKITLSPLARGFLVRCFIEYEAYQRSGVVREEVPSQLKVISCFFELYDKTFPTVQSRTTPTTLPLRPTTIPSEFYTFRNIAYRKTLESISDHNSDVRFRRLVFYVIQFDEPLYNYFSTANEYGDKHSVRTDLRDYSNIQGGIGVFGSITVDSTEYSLSERLRPPDPRPCK